MATKQQLELLRANVALRGREGSLLGASLRALPADE